MTKPNPTPQWPIVAQTRPSLEQLPAIEMRGKDMVVTAGAGAGKTRTLVARYLGLLADGLELRSIVAITFTKKAAREMRNRIRAEMRRYLETLNLDPAERDDWQKRYSELDGARIDTIHGLCADILRSHPAEADIDPNVQVIEEGQASLLLQQVLDRALVHAAETPDLVPLFQLLGETTLRNTLGELLRKRLDVREAFSKMPLDLCRFWQVKLEVRRADALAGLLSDEKWRECVETLRANRASKRDDAIEIQRVQVLETIDGARGTVKEQIARLNTLGKINLTGGSKKAWPDGDVRQKEVKSALKTLRELWKSATALGIEWTPCDGQLAEALPRLATLFQFACDYYESAKRERNILDFDDLESRALDLLQKNPDVQSRWEREICAVLVDEFQDTNERQRSLVRLLNGSPGKLFLVGDAKQSIYRFRGADVTVFRDERDRIKRAGGTHSELATSYRAHHVLIDGLNALMSPVLGTEQDQARPWVEPFAPLRHHREEPGPGFESPHIELHLAIGSKADGAMARAARGLAERLYEIVEKERPKVQEGQQLRPVNYGDVAILCRSSTLFGEYEDALEAAGIPSLTVAGRGFYHRPEVRDLLNALAAIADPTDDLALVGFMRSAVIGISDRSIYRLIRARADAENRDPLVRWVAEHATDLDGDEAHARRGIEIIKNLHNLAGRRSVADVCKALLDCTDYIAVLSHAGHNRAARNVRKLLADAHASGIVNIGEFLEYVNGLRDAAVREGEARSTAEGAVQIMSVHAAKGLEFPIVVLGDITHAPAARNDLLLDRDLGVLLPLKDDEGELPAMYKLGKQRADDQDKAEQARLLYVAATRVREKLLLNGCMKLTNANTPAAFKGWLSLIGGENCLNLVGQQIPYNPEGNGINSFRLSVEHTPVDCRIYEDEIEWPSRESAKMGTDVALPGELLAPIALGCEALDELTRTREEETAPRVWRVVPEGDRPRAPRWVVGSLVHEALAVWRLGDWDQFEAWARARARGHGITDERQLKDAVRETRRILNRLCAHSLYEEMNKAKQRLHEVPFTYEHDGCIESGIMDAVYYDGEIWTMVEFKTDHIRDEDELKKVLAKEDYTEQTERYRRALERLMGVQARVLLCWLDFAGTVLLQENSIRS